MYDSQCASCHKGLSLEEIERGGFQHIGGRLYCADCVAKMRRIGPRECPQCHTVDTPLYNGRHYVCRKCGSEIDPTAGPAPKRTEAPKPKAEEEAARRKRPSKKCPYCGGVLPAEALKCRYCGSPLTREARDLAATDAQNHRLRFWLGVFLAASVFLFFFLLYALVSRRETSPPAQAVGAQDSAQVAALQKQLDELAAYKEQTLPQVDALRDQVGRLTDYIERLEARLEQATRPVLPPPPSLPDKSAPPAKAEPKAPEPKAPEPKSPEAPKAKAPPEKAEAPRKEAPEPTPAERAAKKAYAGFAEQIVRLQAQHEVGKALALCRQFIGAHLGTPQAERVKAQQTRIRQELDALRERHREQFRKAMAKNDFEAARRVIAELSRIQAPEVEQDRKYMAAEVKKAQAQPDHAMRVYLAQWEMPPHVARLVRQLKPNPEGDWTPRAEAAQQLGRIGHRAAMAGLLDALHDPEWFVVSSALEALVAIGDPIALPYIVPLTKASHPAIYVPAAEACRALAQASRQKFAEAWKLVDAKKVAEEMLEALRQPGKEESEVTSRFRIALIESLAHLGVREVAPALRKAVQGQDPAVRRALTAAMKALGSEVPAAPREPSPPAPKGGPAPKEEPAAEKPAPPPAPAKQPPPPPPSKDASPAKAKS